jgi:peptide/nickel transport system substrate-binding protein
MRKFYWYISTFFRKHGVVVLASVIGAILLFSVFLPFVIQKINFKPKKYIGVVGIYTLDNLPSEIREKMSNGLTKLNEDGSATGSLAERWTIEDDGKTYRFLMRQNVLWQDGKPVTPEDLQYNFKDVQILTNPNEIIFKLKDPFSPFPTVLAQPVFRSATEPYLFFFKRRKIIGTGQYQLMRYDEREGGGRLTEVLLDGPNDQLVYRFYVTEADAISGFERGEVDILPNFSNPGGLADWPKIKIQRTLDQHTYLGVFMNLNDDMFRSKEFRLALNYATEKPTDDTRASDPISPLSWAYVDVSKTYDFDKERAIELLLSPNGIPQVPIKFTLTTTTNFINEAEQIKNTWIQIGEEASEVCQKSSDIKDKNLCNNLKMDIDVIVNNFPDTSNFQALLIGQTVPPDPDQYPIWHSGQITNFTGYRNTRIDSLLERGRQTDDQRKRIEIYTDFQQFFSEDPPVIFLRYLDKYTMSR